MSSISSWVLTPSPPPSPSLCLLPPQFPVISEFGENTNSYCSFETKETALLHSENGNLQQRVNALTHEVSQGWGGGGVGWDTHMFLMNPTLDRIE